MNIGRAFFAGVRRVLGAKRYLFLVYLINFCFALIMAIALAAAIEGSLGSSLAADNLRDGFDPHWYQGFSAQATGLAATFNPSVVGIGAVFNGLDTFVQGNLFGGYGLIVGAGVLYMVLWTFLSAGFISVYKRPEEHGSLLQQSAHFFPRFAVLAIMAGVVYWLIFRFIMPWTGNIVSSLTHETIDERIAFSYTLIQYLVIWTLVWLVAMVFDYSKIITVVEDRGNALTTPLKALWFVGRHPGRAIGLYIAVGLTWVVILFVYWGIAPGAGQSTITAVAFAFLIGQLYILSRIVTKCLFWACQTAMYESFQEAGVSVEVA